MQLLAEAYLAHCTACAEKLREFIACQQLIPCLAENLNLARVCRNLKSWGSKVGCATPDGMVTDVNVSVWDAHQCSRPQECKCV